MKLSDRDIIRARLELENIVLMLDRKPEHVNIAGALRLAKMLLELFGGIYRG